MSRDAQEAEAAARTSCPLCGGNTFTWGVARGRDWFKFRADNVGFLARNFGGQTVKARKCDSCGNVQLFAVD